MSRILDKLACLFCVPWTLISVPLHGLMRLLKPQTPLHKDTDGALNGCAVMVTGANTGIGFKAAQGFAERGAHVLLACRSEAKGRAAVDSILKTGGSAELVVLDLSDLESVRSCAKEVAQRKGGLDVLVNNGGLAGGRGSTVQGFRLVYGVNFVGHFLLSALLLPTLSASRRGGRIVNLSSITHRFAEVRALRGNAVRAGYAESKLALLLLSIELNGRFAGKVTAVAVNPGAVRSDIWRGVPQLVLTYVYDPFMALFFLDTTEGAATTLAAATESFTAPPPHGVWYLSPYWIPPYLPAACVSPFDMMGPFIGSAPAQPRLPSEAKHIASLLWEDTESLIRTCNEKLLEPL